MPVSYKLLFAEEEPQVIGVDMTRACIEVCSHCLVTVGIQMVIKG
jgi:hypothetical protein